MRGRGSHRAMLCAVGAYLYCGRALSAAEYFSLTLPAPHARRAYDPVRRHDRACRNAILPHTRGVHIIFGGGIYIVVVSKSGARRYKAKRGDIMRKTALLCLCTCLLFTAAVCFCSCKSEGGTAALSEDAVTETEVGIVAYLYSVGEDSADIMKNAVSDELSERLGGTVNTDYMALRDTGEVRDVLEMMCRSCDAVITLDNTSALICAELYGGTDREEYKAAAFFCCADADTSQKAMSIGMSGSTCTVDCARTLAEIAAVCGFDAQAQSRKPGIIYNSGSPTAAETVCSVFDSAGLGYAVYAADSTSDLSIASAELCSVGAGAVIIPYMPSWIDEDALPACDVPVFCAGDVIGADRAISLCPDHEFGARAAARLAADRLEERRLEDDSSDRSDDQQLPTGDGGGQSTAARGGTAPESVVCPIVLRASRAYLERYGLTLPELCDGIRADISE